MKYLLITLLSLSLIACGDSGSGGDKTPETPETPETPLTPIYAANIELEHIHLKEYGAFGTVTTTEHQQIMEQTVGLKTSTNSIGPGTMSEVIEPINVTFSLSSATEGNDESSDRLPECLPELPVHIISEENVGFDWRIISAQIPNSYSDCEYQDLQTKYYFSHDEHGLFEFPNGLVPHQEWSVGKAYFKFIPSNSAFNNSDEVVMLIENHQQDYAGGYLALYSVYLPKWEAGEPQFRLSIPDVYENGIHLHGRTNFALKDDHYLYFRKDNKLIKMDENTGDFVQAWENATEGVPFIFKRKIYGYGYKENTGYDHGLFELLPDGTLGDELVLNYETPDYINSFIPTHVYHDNFLINSSCDIIDVDNNIYVNDFTDYADSITVLNEEEVFCSSTMSMPPTVSYFKFGDVNFEQMIELPDSDTVRNTLKVEAPFAVYDYKGNNIFETDTYTLDIRTGESSIETHYYNGERVINLTPVH
ncbi:MAG: hypothetical protein P8M49_08475 [Thalassotalea sp.]|nr:hypothetical protein [Thalassotalea sp.]MDG2393533.1 hypothetical protein [Thalassotalea sp.]